MTIIESSSSLLRRAADRLDELAAAVAVDGATPDLPWHVEECANEETGDCPCIVAQGLTSHHDEPPTAMFYVADAETPALATYIAAMHPLAGRAFAGMLRTEAASAAGDEDHGACLPETCTTLAAMVAARKILGEAS